jgi:hypothetical protein
VDSDPVVVMSTGTVGVFTETVTLTPTDYNPSGFSVAQAPETVTITGTVVAAPKPTPASRTANSWGDVHITTFDGLYYNFQAQGEFIYAESTVAGDSFAVQGRLEPESAGSSVTLNTEIAAKIGADTVVFAVDQPDTVYIDGVAAGLTALNQVVTLAGGTLEEQSANSYELIWNTGEELQVTDEGTYLNMNLTLPNSDAGNVQGLLGPDDGNPADDLMLPGGTSRASMPTPGGSPTPAPYCCTSRVRTPRPSPTPTSPTTRSAWATCPPARLRRPKPRRKRPASPTRTCWKRRSRTTC